MENAVDSYRRFLDGDDSGLAEIIRDYKDGLMIYLNGYVKDIAVAQELTEETFVKLVLKRPQFLKRSAFKTWLYTIARNVALDHLRQRSRRNEVPLEDCPEVSADEETLERAYIRQEERIMLHRAMEKLKQEYRQVLWLVYFEDFTHKDVAKIMGKTTHSVEMLAYRARQALKTKLFEEGYDYEEL